MSLVERVFHSHTLESEDLMYLRVRQQDCIADFLATGGSTDAKSMRSAVVNGEYVMSIDSTADSGAKAKAKGPQIPTAVKPQPARSSSFWPQSLGTSCCHF